MKVPLESSIRKGRLLASPVSTMTTASGLNDQILAGENVTFEFKYDPAAAIGVDSFTNMINDFSSWGPTLDVRQKPEISAPGELRDISDLRRS